jgi:alpha,alpha-trehalase
VDLNSCLYKYETDLALFYRAQKNSNKAKQFEAKAEQRRDVMHSLMWNKKKKFFFDYNNTKNQQGTFLSVAGFYPLWARLATQAQADAICELMLPVFEFDGGMVNTQRYKLSDESKQHDFPNGWPHQQWIVIKGLMNYGFRDEAARIAKKWLNMNEAVFLKTGQFWEKYDVVNRDIGVSNPDRYPTQSGFAWTNAIFVRLAHEFENQNEKK